MEYQTLQLSNSNFVTTVTLNRPEKMNALNSLCIRELGEAFAFLEKDGNTRCVILTGSGEKAFVAGADISELASLTVPQAKETSLAGQKAFQSIESFSKPVIAAVNGFALGGGAELAWSCHIRIASENAKFGQPEINLGLIPGYGGTQRLSRMLPRTKAYELMLTGDMINAQDALQWGLVSAVYPFSELMPNAVKLAEKLASKPAEAVALMLKAIRSAAETQQSDGISVEAALFALCFDTADFREGTGAFLEKRKPNFTHK